jgi:hypothetical protein
MREEACKIVLSPQSNQSYVLVLPATLEFQPRMSDVKGLNLDGAESGNGRTKKESCCNLVLPQRNGSDVLVLVTLELQPVLNCYVQGDSRELLLYKSIVASFNITCCSTMSVLLD